MEYLALYVLFTMYEVGVFLLFYMSTDFYTLRKDVETVLERVEEIRAAAGLKQLQEDLAALEAAAADSSLWDNHAKAQETLQTLTDCKDKLKLLHEFKTKVPTLSFKERWRAENTGTKLFLVNIKTHFPFFLKHLCTILVLHWRSYFILQGACHL